jgi:photoactive yellow protein
MSTANQIHDKFYGLLELDPAGRVLYSRIEQDGGAAAPDSDVTGRNFYTDVAPFKNVGEFQHRLDSFNRSSQQADSIHFTCDYDDGPLAVKVLLARIRECSEHDVTKSILVHIRKV